jgi:glycosyltransferase involved in cell wall biosynthesis
MKIGIIAFGYIPAGTGGTETYFRSLLDGLQKYDNSNEYTLVVDKKYLSSAKKLIASKKWKVKGLTGIPPKYIRGLRKIKVVKSSNDDLLAKKINSMNFDLVHFPFQVIYPYGIDTKKVLTFHDMQEEYFPEFFSKDEMKFRKNNFNRSVIEADLVITVSKHTKLDILKYYGQGLIKKVLVVYESVPKKVQFNISNNSILQHKPYFYYPAATWPHKNHERLIKAFKKFVKKHPEFRLVLSGLSRQKSDTITNLINELDLKQKVVMLGYLPYEQLPSLFKNSYALVFPSLFEGFGIPLLESMQYDIPVLCSNSTSLPEVGGRAAIYFNPTSINDIANKMTRIAEDKELYNKLRKECSKQRNKFSIKKMTFETIAVYNKAYNEK